jgi:hypothetical protein
MTPLPPLDFGLEAGLSVKDVHRRALVAHLWGQQAERRLAFYLREMDERRLYRDMGCSDVFHYATTALGLDRRRARALLRLAETLERLPAVAEAFEAGQLGWTKVREIAPIAHEGNEGEWLEKALTLTSRELEQAVARAGGRPARSLAAAEVVAAPDGDGEEVELTLRMPVSVFGMWQDAVRKAREEGGGSVTEPEAFEYVCREFLNTPFQERDVNNPYSLALYVCKKCGEGEVATPDGPIAVKPSEVGAALCDARVLDVEREAEGRAFGKGWPLLGPEERESYEAGELERRLTTIVDLAERAPIHSMVRTAPRALRRFLLHRDRGCCAVPGCQRRLWLHAHHIVFFVNGGPTEKDNLVLVCSTHHRLIHEGKVRVRGEAPDRLIWTRADGTPLREAPIGVVCPTWDGAGLFRERPWYVPAHLATRREEQLADRVSASHHPNGRG